MTHRAVALKMQVTFFFFFLLSQPKTSDALEGEWWLLKTNLLYIQKK